MSNEVNETELNLDLAFLPAWAQESPQINRYANYEGEREGRRGGFGKGPRSDRPFGGPRPNRDRPREDRPGGFRQPPRGEAQRGGPREDRSPRGREGQFDRGGSRFNRPQYEKRPELPPIGIEINLVPESHGVDSLTKQIRVTGRAYPLFDIARLVLQKDERFGVEFRAKTPADGGAPQPLFTCVLDDTAWLSEEEAVNHVLENHLATFYQVEKVPTDPPKGTYTFVAQCGMSGVILGPPNYHDYQNKLHKLHQERFGTMPFDRFKSRVKIVRDEEVVKKWVEEQSFRTEFTVLNVPEPLKLAKWDDVREHFRTIHLPNIIKPVERLVVSSARARRGGSRELQRHVGHEIEQQRRFPLKMVTTLSQQFASRGLQFFKVNKTIVHVAVARPHFLDIDAGPISEGVKQIVQYVNAHPRCSVKNLVEALAPAIQPPPGAEAQPATEAKPASHEPTGAQKVVLSDLHWLVHSGHVIEFANGELETAKKPSPKPVQAPKKKDAPRQPAAATPATAVVATEPAAHMTSGTGAPAAAEASAPELQAPAPMPKPSVEPPRQPDAPATSPTAIDPAPAALSPEMKEPGQPG